MMVGNGVVLYLVGSRYVVVAIVSVVVEASSQLGRWDSDRHGLAGALAEMRR